MPDGFSHSNYHKHTLANSCERSGFEKPIELCTCEIHFSFIMLSNIKTAESEDASTNDSPHKASVTHVSQKHTRLTDQQSSLIIIAFVYLRIYFDPFWFFFLPQATKKEEFKMTYHQKTTRKLRRFPASHTHYGLQDKARQGNIQQSRRKSLGAFSCFPGPFFFLKPFH